MMEGKTPRLRILVVEDNPVNQRIAQHYVKNFGFEAELASNGREGVDKFLNDDFDMILMDLNMPVMDGFQATSKIRDFEKKQKKRKPIFIVAVTANNFVNDEKKCFDSGMDAYLSKPYRIDELKKTIQLLKAV